MSAMRSWLRELYFGSDKTSALFQYTLLAFDTATVAFFLVLTFVDHDAAWIAPVDFVIVIVMTADFIARTWISVHPLKHLMRPVTLADLVVILSLALYWVWENLAFLRILRMVRVLRSYHVLGQLKRKNSFVRRNEELIFSIINLLVFIFFVTAIVFVTQHETNDAIDDYIDALYFTVTTLTTTGFGDITLEGPYGRLLAVLIMIFGISFFLRLLQVVFRPAKVFAPCETCGLQRHDPDAVHCKHCGETINIPAEGD